MSQILDTDEMWMEDLDAEIAAAVLVKSRALALARAKRELKAGAYGADLSELAEAVRHLEEGVVWNTVDEVALFHSQTCGTCGSRHRFFMGWMVGQNHATDRTAHRLFRDHEHGRHAPPLPQRIQEHDMGTVEVCSDCVECCLAIDAAARGVL